MGIHFDLIVVSGYHFFEDFRGLFSLGVKISPSFSF
jgi:hypothetical protein